MSELIINKESDRELYSNYIFSCINSGTLESIMSFEDFLDSIYTEQIDDLYINFVANLEQYNQEINNF